MLMLIARHKDRRRPFLTILLLAVVFILPGFYAYGATASDCVPVVGPDGSVIVPCDEGGAPGGPGEPGDGSDDGGGGGDGICRDAGDEIPCSTEYGTWNGICYARAMAPQPPPSDPRWKGTDPNEGVMVECTPNSCIEAGTVGEACEGLMIYPSDSAPEPAGPSPEELARRAVAQMNLSMGAIGSTPPTSAQDPGALGSIGLPVWLWIANRGENTTGPITRSASDGGLTVSATGTLDRVEWTLTNAAGTIVATISCDGDNAGGTPYDGRDTAEPSPTCGFGADLNQTPGNLTLTGTAYWSVQWEGGDQSGSIDVPAQSNNAELRIGETQVLVQD